MIPPHRLRSLPVFSAFATAMPKVLDFNHKMGTILLSTCLPLLTYCPSPQRYVHDSWTGQTHLPLYSLYHLKSHVRSSWLTAVLIILYKYMYNKPPVSRQVRVLIQIVMNTLESVFHICRPHQQYYISPSATRSRGESLHVRQMRVRENLLDMVRHVPC